MQLRIRTGRRADNFFPVVVLDQMRIIYVTWYTPFDYLITFVQCDTFVTFRAAWRMVYRTTA
jgi:hypothetical protein